MGWFNNIYPEKRPLRWVLPLVLLLFMTVIQIYLPDLLRLPEAWTEDLRFIIRGPEQSRNEIIIVALDEDSFQMLGDLDGENIRTWPLTRWAELISKISTGEPRVIGIDVVFDTPG